LSSLIKARFLAAFLVACPRRLFGLCGFINDPSGFHADSTPIRFHAYPDPRPVYCGKSPYAIRSFLVTDPAHSSQIYENVVAYRVRCAACAVGGRASAPLYGLLTTLTVATAQQCRRWQGVRIGRYTALVGDLSKGQCWTRSQRHLS
jgi:hypothetical protein